MNGLFRSYGVVEDFAHADIWKTIFDSQDLQKCSKIFLQALSCYGGEYRINEDVLIVLPPQESSERLCTTLKSKGFSITLTQDVQTAFEELKKHLRTFLIIDFGLPNADSFLVKVVKMFYDPPPYIIVIDFFPCSTAQAEMLNLGADICLEKPLDLTEVLAVINAITRRANRIIRPTQLQTAPHIDKGTLQIDPLGHSVTIDGESVTLTVKEFGILQLLSSYPGAVFSKEQIYELVWNEDYKFATTSVSDMISSIRKKLGLNPKEGRYIQTVFGAGYRFVEPTD